MSDSKAIITAYKESLQLTPTLLGDAISVSMCHYRQHPFQLF